MKVNEIGEFGLIKRVMRPSGNSNVLVGIGDDAAVVREGGILRLYTTDMLVEGDHFRFDWSTPLKIGRKAMASNVSDIAAMGGIPDFALVSIALTPGIDVETVEEIYEGMYQVADRHGVEIIGGDTTHGSAVVINIVLMGTVEEDMLRLRSGARPGDRIFVTGHLGGSHAGLQLLLNGREGPKEAIEKHFDPGCRMDISRDVARIATAMIDVSDGLASEVNHICEMSGTGALVRREDIPLAPYTREVAEILDMDPYEFALSGGEDFELVFTVPPEKAPEAERYGTEVGVITSADEGVMIENKGKRYELRGGYDHFKQ